MRTKPEEEVGSLGPSGKVHIPEVTLLYFLLGRIASWESRPQAQQPIAGKPVGEAFT